MLSANAADLEAGRQAGLSQALLDRLALSEQRIAGIVEGVRQVAALPDPVGTETRRDTLKSGLVHHQAAGAPGGHRHHLRGPAQRDGGRGGPVPEGGQRRHPPGRQGGVSAPTPALMAIMRDAVEAAGLPRDSLALVADTSREQRHRS